MATLAPVHKMMRWGSHELEKGYKMAQYWEYGRVVGPPLYPGRKDQTAEFWEKYRQLAGTHFGSRTRDESDRLRSLDAIRQTGWNPAWGPR